ncbi:MAG TPA: diacylglycerol kinase family protein [Acidimicrobiia bacterium]|jgi:diacylglycerol kinase family enzyme|nr:diacylglycerol kinase family protein [Acidimicrobiia bacterium]
MRVLLLVNATASSVTARKRVMIRKMLATHHEVELAETSRRGHATRLAHAAANDGFDVVAVLAGDGTLNETADGLLHTNTALAPLPGGSTNVYARTLGYPNDAVAAAQVLLGSLARSATKRIGVGTANHRPFLFNTGIGFDAAVIRRVERYGELKRYMSHPLHVAAAVEAFFRKEGTTTRVDIELDSGETIDGVRFAIVSKTDPYTFLGPLPLRVAPNASLDTPLALTGFRSMDMLTLLGGAASAMRKGEFLAHRQGVEHRRDVHRLLIRAATPFSYQVDGDDVGDTQQLDVVYEPDALTVIVP